MKRSIAFSIILLLALPCLADEREGSSEFELFAGSHLGDSFTMESDYGYHTYELDDSVLLGLRGGYFLNNHLAMEFTLAGTLSQTWEGDDFNLYYYQGNLLLHFGEANFAPFVTVGVGVTTTNRPDLSTGYGERRHQVTDSNFSWNFGGGFKVYFNNNFALRTDIRSYWTAMDDRSCDNGDYDENCWNNENVLNTTEISAGFVFRF
jgi:outer membrane protein W